MIDQRAAYERFRDLQRGPDMLVMPNPWDGASALLMKRAGFTALGSSSAAIAWSMGRQDGRRAVARAEAIAHAGLIARVTGLPVNGDLEDGFGATPADCVATVEAAIAGGLAGLGIEDTTASADPAIHEFDTAVARVRAAAAAARGRIWLTGRTDLLLHGHGDLDAIERRLVAFAEAGADMVYAPGLATQADVARMVRAVAPVPLNVLIWGGLEVAAIAAAGARRLSLGASLYLATMGALAQSATALADGDAARALAAKGEGGAFLPMLG